MSIPTGSPAQFVAVPDSRPSFVESDGADVPFVKTVLLRMIRRVRDLLGDLTRLRLDRGSEANKRLIYDLGPDDD